MSKEEVHIDADDVRRIKGRMRSNEEEEEEEGLPP